MTKKQLAAAGLASQGRCLMLADQLNAQELALIADSMTPDGKATVDTALACQQAIKIYHDRMKAVVDED